jgi:glycosyltransferase involved in cell wall biosynthesis
MKVLIFAHTPPPHHGQSYMLQLMLNGFGGDHAQPSSKVAAPNPTASIHGIESYHVNTRFSKELEDIGEIRGRKALLLFGYCLKAIWYRYRHGVTNFYYIPAPGKKSALYRDWLVLFLCRPFFERLILHWHAAGLAKWLETSVQIRSRSLTYRFAKHADLSIVLSKYNIADAEKLLPERIRVVSNGIPDPCPNYEDTIQLQRSARFAARQKILAGHALEPTDYEQAGAHPDVIRVLFLAHCIREKGLFDTMRAIAMANATLAELQPRLRFRLIIAGTFVTQEEKEDYERYMKGSDLAHSVEYWGFVSGEMKERAFREADLFCFPTYYLGENQPVNIIEAMAYGLPVVTTNWRSLPEMLPPNYCGLVPIRSADRVAAALLLLMTRESGEGLRQIFLSRFTIEKHLTALAKAITSIEQPVPAAATAANFG